MKKIVKNIIVNDKFFVFEEGNGRENKITWENIIKVIIETGELDPFENDLSLILITIEEEIYIPQDLDGFEDLLKFLQTFFPDFNNNAVIQAMSSVSSGVFEVWHK